MKIGLKLALVLGVAVLTVSTQIAARPAALVPAGPTFKSIGPLAFTPAGEVLFAGDRDAATIYALKLGGGLVASSKPGTGSVEGIDQKIAAALGTGAAEITITDLAVHPQSRNSFVSVMRGQGANAQPALVRIDGSGSIDVIDLSTVTFSSVTLPNPPTANPGGRNDPRTQAIMDIAFVNGRVIVAGLSNEEFASKLWSVAYPFAASDNGTSIEIFHGNHGRLETNSPIFSFVSYDVGGQPSIIGGYLCTPLVKIPVSALKPGQKVMGTTIAELGNGNRPIDMIVYKKDGQEYLLMSNTSRGVMKIPTAQFATNAPITAPVRGTQGTFETIGALQGVEQLDLLDREHTVLIVKTAAGRNLTAVVLP